MTLNKEGEESKSRKRTSGAIKDKKRTKARMVQAVGKVLLKKGYTGLNATSIAKECGVDKRLVWTYFGSLDNLVETYITQRDFWKSTASDSIMALLSETEGITSQQIGGLLQSQFETLLNDNVLQRIIHWEIGENKKFLRNLADQREEIGEELFKLIEMYFQKGNVDIRAILALLVGGIYYLALHSKINGSLFCGIDINEPQGEQRIKDAISYIITSAYTDASAS